MSRKRPFRWFQPEMMAEDACCGFFGPRNSGKTVTMTSILATKDLDRGIAMCPTPEAFTTYSEFIPLPYIYQHFDEEALDRAMRFQQAARFRIHQIWRHEMAELEVAAQALRARKWDERMDRLEERATQRGWTQQQVEIAYERAVVDEEAEEKVNGEMRQQHGRDRKKELRRPYSMFCILDDLSSEKSTMKSELLKKIINNGRHFMLMLFVAVQYVMDFPAACRGGLDWVCVFWDTLEPNVKRLYESIVGVFPTLHDFKAALQDACRQGACLMVKKNMPTADPWDCVFFYRAKVTHLSARYFGGAAYEYVANMFLDEAKFQASVTAVRDPSDVSSGKASKGKPRKSKKTAAAESNEPEAEDEEGENSNQTAAANKKSRKKQPQQEVDMDPAAAGLDAWDDEDEEARTARERVKEEQDAKVKQGVASLRQRLARISQEARARQPPPGGP